MNPHLLFPPKVKGSCPLLASPGGRQRVVVDHTAAQPTGRKVVGTLALEGSRQGLSTFANPSSLEGLEGRKEPPQVAVGRLAKRMASKRGYINPAPVRPPSPMTLLGQAGRGRSRVYHPPVLFLFPVSCFSSPLPAT